METEVEIDLLKFVAIDDDRSYLNFPMRTEEGVVACNGHILICVQIEGEFAKAPPMLARAIAPFAAMWTTTGVRMDDIALPETKACEHCEGTGTLYIKDCDHCAGEGEFENGNYTYECETCAGAGVNVVARDKGGLPTSCHYCKGTGKFSSFKVNKGNYNLPHLQLLKTLPDCTLYPNDELVAKFEFDGGWGVLMPVNHWGCT